MSKYTAVRRPRKGRCLEHIKSIKIIILFRSPNLTEVHAPRVRRSLVPRACRIRAARASSTFFSEFRVRSLSISASARAIGRITCGLRPRSRPPGRLARAVPWVCEIMTHLQSACTRTCTVHCMLVILVSLDRYLVRILVPDLVILVLDI